MKLHTKLMLSICYIALLAVNGCKKDSAEISNTTPPTTNTNNQKCKFESEYANDTLVSTLKYNASGNLIKQIFYDKGIATDSVIATYNGSTVVVTYTGSNPGVITYKIGSKGYAIQSINDDGTFKDTTNYTYDNNGFLTRSVSPNLTANYTIENGNITHETLMYSNDTIYNVYEYHPDKVDVVGFDRSNIDEFLLGKASKNLPKKITSTDNTNITDIVEFDWILENGLPVKVNSKTTENNVSTTDKIRYTFLCK